MEAACGMVARRNVPKELSCSIMRTRSFRPGLAVSHPSSWVQLAMRISMIEPPLASCSTGCKTPAASDSWSMLTSFAPGRYAIERVRCARC